VIRCGPGSGGTAGQNDLFRARLDQIVDMDHPVAKLGRAIDWRFLEERFGKANKAHIASLGKGRGSRPGLNTIEF
jgi:hypothetical protein